MYPPGDLLNPGIEPALQADSLPSELPGKPLLDRLGVLSAFSSLTWEWKKICSLYSRPDLRLGRSRPCEACLRRDFIC